MEGVSGRQGIAGRLASTLGALAVDFGNRDLGLLGHRPGRDLLRELVPGDRPRRLRLRGRRRRRRRRRRPRAPAARRPRLALRRPARRPLPAALGPDRQRPGDHRRPRRDLRRGGDGQRRFVVAILAGVFTAAISGYVPAEAALLPALARSPQELSAANVTHSAMDNVGFLAAALTTGLLLHSAGPATVFGVAAAVALITTAGLTLIERDERPAYAADGELSGLWRQSVLGFRTLLADPGLRLLGALLVVIVFFEGTTEVLVVILALDLLHLDHGSVGYLNAAWGVGALLGGATLSVMLGRGRLAVGLAVGSADRRPGDRAAGALDRGRRRLPRLAGRSALGYTVAEVAAKTLLQRLGSDETLSRVIGSLESARLAAMALGSISASVFFELLGIRGALLLAGARCCRVFVGAELDPAAGLRGRRPGRRGAVPAAARQLDLRAAAGGDPGADQPRPGRRARCRRARR